MGLRPAEFHERPARPGMPGRYRNWRSSLASPPPPGIGQDSFARRLCIAGESIAYPRFCKYILRLTRVSLDLLPHLIHEYAQILRFVAIIRAPYGLQQFAVGHRFAGMHYQIAEQLELLRRQPYVPALGAYVTSFEVDFQISRRKRARALGRG